MEYVRFNGRMFPDTCVKIYNLTEDFRRMGVSIPEQARELGIHKSALSHYRNGQLPSIAVLPHLCEYYDVSADWLLGVGQ